VAYDQIKKKSGRTPIYIVDIELDRCTRTYGVAPCTASGPAAGKCVNSLGTCQDPDNYEEGTFTLRFASTRIDAFDVPNGDFNDDFNDDFGPPTITSTPALPTLMAVKTQPTRLTPGLGLGWRSVVNVTITDAPYTDVGLDPYVNERGFSWLTRGTFWQRFLDRYPYYENSRFRIYTGYADFDADGNQLPLDFDNFRKRSYLLKKIGIGSNGTVSIEAEDPLKLANASTTQWPPQSAATLLADITDVQTSFDIDDPNGLVQDFVNVRGQPYVRISDEVMLVNSYAAPTLTVTRATLPSFYPGAVEAEEHKAGDTVQVCFLYNNVRIDDALYQLLNDATGIPSEFLPLDAWVAEADEYFAAYFFDRLVVQPVAVKEYVTEITELNAMVWWDERSQVVDFKALKATPNNVAIPTFNDALNILSEGVSLSQTPKDRISEVNVRFGERSPVASSDKPGFFAQVRNAVDEEAAERYGVQAIRTIYSPWLSSAGSAVALEVASRLLNEYRDTKTIIGVGVDPKDDDVWTGDTVNVNTQYIRDQYGAIPTRRYLLTEVNEVISPDEGVRYAYRLQSVGGSITSRVGLVAPDTISAVDEPLQAENGDNLETEGDEVLEVEDGTVIAFPDYLDASDTLRNTYAFISLNDGLMTNGDVGYVAT